MKKYAVLFLSFLIVFSLFPAFAYADTGNESGIQELVEVVWDGTVSGSVCEATVTLYKHQSADPIDAEYQRMWGTFRLVITDESGNVLVEEEFNTASKTISLTEPGDYYACVYTARGDQQGLTGSDGSYTPLTQHFSVTGTHEPTIYDELGNIFVNCCDSYPEEHDRAFREYLAMLHELAASNEAFSLTEAAVYMMEAICVYGDQSYIDLYEEFHANEGYATMEVTSLAGYDSAILAEEEIYGFWSGECWRYLASGMDLVTADGDEFRLLPYDEYFASIDGGVPDEDEPSNGDSPLDPLVLVGAVVVVVAVLGIGTAVILTRRKKNG